MNHKEVMQWYSKNKKLVYNTFDLNSQLGIDSVFTIKDTIVMVICPRGFPDVHESSRSRWRFRFLQRILEKRLINTVQR